MKKSKGEKIDLLYMSNKVGNFKKEAKKKEKQRKKQEKQKRKQAIQKRKSEQKLAQNEIIVNIPKIQENKIKPKKKKELEKYSVKTKQKNNTKVQKQIKINKKRRENPEFKKTNKNKIKILKWLIIITILFIGIMIFIYSSLFNIKNIVIKNNSKTSAEEIIKLSELNNNINIFKVSQRGLEKKLKQNPYIESIDVKKSLNGILTITVKERIPTYILKFANAYVYINNQGYILEIADNMLELPVIIGFKTSTDNIKIGNRLELSDLKRLDVIIKIMDYAKRSNIDKKITGIDISNKTSYTLILEKELKTVNFGDASYINDKIIRIEAILEKEKDIEGIIFVDNINKVYFREKV